MFGLTPSLLLRVLLFSSVQAQVRTHKCLDSYSGGLPIGARARISASVGAGILFAIALAALFLCSRGKSHKVTVA